MAVYLGLGSNLGARHTHLETALAEMTARGVTIVRRSAIYETEALLPAGAPDDWDIAFLNMVAEVQTSLSPHDLLAVLKTIERKMGRRDLGRWAPRVIDIDILFYHDLRFCDDRLTIPHPEMENRGFVLVPLAELAPDLQIVLRNGPDKGQNRTIGALAQSFELNRFSL